MEQVYFAERPNAWGILEAIEHYDFFHLYQNVRVMVKRIPICTDLDRTLLPSDSQPEQPGAREIFANLVSRPEVTLAYVSGRHCEWVVEAIGDYGLPAPDLGDRRRQNHDQSSEHGRM